MKPIEKNAIGRVIYWLAAVRQDLETLKNSETMKGLSLDPTSVTDNALRCLKNADDLVEGIALGSAHRAIIADNIRQTG
jgi:hypothetical protein